jgi:hypothetical protein
MVGGSTSASGHRVFFASAPGADGTFATEMLVFRNGYSMPGIGSGQNSSMGAVTVWWWADPVAALGMTWFLVAEDRKDWRSEDCGCSRDGGRRRRWSPL